MKINIRFITTMIVAAILLLQPPSAPYLYHPVDATETVSGDNSRDYITEYPFSEISELNDITVEGEMVWFTQFNVSKLWNFNTSSGELNSIELPDDITPLFVDVDDQGSIWFLDYDYLPSETIDYVGTFNPNDGNITYFPLASMTHAINFEVNNQYAIVTILNQDRLVLIDTVTHEKSEVIMDCNQPCGPAGQDFDEEGNLWITDTLGDKYIKYSFEDDTFEAHSMPTSVRSPTFIKFDDNGWLWISSHAGDRLARVNITDHSLTQFISPQPNDDQYPTSGINDIEFDSNGDIWFAEHFINRIGRIDQHTNTILEYVSPREEPRTAFIDIADDKLWFPDDYGNIGFISTELAPKVTITQLDSLTLDEETEGKLTFNVSYLSGFYDQIEFSVFGEYRNIEGITVNSPDDYILKRGESIIIEATLEIIGVAPASHYNFLVGIRSDSFTATNILDLTLLRDWTQDDFGINYSQILSYGLPVIFVIIAIFISRNGGNNKKVEEK